MTVVGAIKNAYTAAEERLHALIVQLEESGHVLAGEIRKEFNLLHGRAAVVEAEVKADAEQVAHDAEAAAAPVVTEAERDAQTVAGEVTQDATAAVAEAAAPAATPAEPVKQ